MKSLSQRMERLLVRYRPHPPRALGVEEGRSSKAWGVETWRRGSSGVQESRPLPLSLPPPGPSGDWGLEPGLHLLSPVGGEGRPWSLG